MTILATDRVEPFHSVVSTYSQLLVVASLVSRFSFGAKWQFGCFLKAIQFIQVSAPLRSVFSTPKGLTEYVNYLSTLASSMIGNTASTASLIQHRTSVSKADD